MRIFRGTVYIMSVVVEDMPNENGARGKVEENWNQHDQMDIWAYFERKKSILLRNCLDWN